LFKRYAAGESTDVIANVLVDIACDFADRSSCASGSQLTVGAVALTRPIVEDPALVDVACAGKRFATGTDVDVTLTIKGEVDPAKLAVRANRFVPNGHVRLDTSLHQPFEHAGRPIGGIANKPVRLQIKAALDALHHGLGYRDLF
jgi:hypothetical protein